MTVPAAPKKVSLAIGVAFYFISAILANWCEGFGETFLSIHFFSLRSAPTGVPVLLTSTRLQWANYTIPPILQLRRLEFNSGRRETEMLIILLVVLLVLSLGSFPSWPYSRNWGYYPSGGLGLVVVILLILLLLGRI